MFDTEIGKEETSVMERLGRRAFLLSAGSALTGLLVWSVRGPESAQANASTEPAGDVTIVEFSDDGKRLKKMKIPKVVKTEDEWRKLLAAQRLFDHSPRRYRDGIFRRILEPA